MCQKEYNDLSHNQICTFFCDINKCFRLESCAYPTMTVSVYLTADHEAAHTRSSHFCSDECHGCHLHSDLAVRQHLGEFKKAKKTSFSGPWTKHIVQIVTHCCVTMFHLERVVLKLNRVDLWSGAHSDQMPNDVATALTYFQT